MLERATSRLLFFFVDNTKYLYNLPCKEGKYIMKDPIDNMVFKILDDFKDGTYDALIHGIRSETNKTNYYKQGYDFGLVLYNDQIDGDDK